MIGEKVTESRIVSLYDVKELLSERKKEKELTYEQDITLKYAKHFSKLTKAKYEKLLKELDGVKEIDEKFKVKLLDIVPVTEEQVKVLAPKNIEIGKVTAKKLAEICSKYSPKK